MAKPKVLNDLALCRMLLFFTSLFDVSLGKLA